MVSIPLFGRSKWLHCVVRLFLSFFFSVLFMLPAAHAAAAYDYSFEQRPHAPYAIPSDHLIQRKTYVPLKLRVQKVEKGTEPSSMSKVLQDLWFYQEDQDRVFLDKDSVYQMLAFIKTPEAMKDSHWVLSIDHPYPMFEKLRLVQISNNKPTNFATITQELPIEQRQLPVRSMAFPVMLEPNTVYQWLLTAQTDQPQEFSVSLQTSTEYLVRTAKHESWWGAFLSIFVVAALYSLISFLFTRKKMHLGQMGFSVSALFFLIGFSGHGSLYFWKYLPEYNKLFSLAFLGLLQVAALYFVVHFLSLRRFLPKSFVVARLLMLTLLILTVVALAVGFSYGSIILDCSLLLLTVFLTLISALSMRQSVHGSLIFTVGFSFTSIFTLVFFAAKYGVLESNRFTQLSPQMGFLAEVIMFTAAMSLRVRRAYQQRDYLVTKQKLTIEKLTGVEERLQKQVMYNRTTGLPNKNCLSDRLHNVFSSSSDCMADQSGHYYLAIFEIHNLKTINNNFGHYYGERLRLIAASLLKKAIVRCVEDDAVCLDGHGACLCSIDESSFGALIYVDAQEDSDTVIESRVRCILASIVKTVKVDSINIELSLVCGVCPIASLDDPNLYICNANVAVEQAISSLNDYYLYDQAFAEKKKAELEIVNDLRIAIEKNQFEIYLQPQLDIKRDMIVAAEALIRWPHPTKGYIFPDQFIPLAERAGLIQQITRYVIDETARQIRALHDNGFGLSVAINVSAKDIGDSSLTDYITNVLSIYRIPHTYLTLELTESDVETDVDNARKVIGHWNDLGFRSSLDDFGTGYSSLFRMKEYPTHEIKVDRSFVMGLDRNRDLQAIVQSVIDMGHGLGMHIVAEGVENEAILAILKDMGCDLAQGYLLARPLPEQEMLDWLQQTHYKVAGSPQ